MPRDEAIRVADTAVGDACALTIHEGATPRDVAVRLSGLDLRGADALGFRLQGLLPGGKYVRDGNFAAVWFDATD